MGRAVATGRSETALRPALRLAAGEVGHDLRVIAVQPIEDEQQGDHPPCEQVAADVDIRDHGLRAGGDGGFAGKARQIEQQADGGGRDAATEFLSGGGGRDDHALQPYAGLPVAVFDDIREHGIFDAAEAALADAAQHAGEQREGQAARCEKLSGDADRSDHRTDKGDVALAKAVDERRQQ